MSRQHVAVAVAGLCVTLVAGTLAEVNQHLSQTDSFGHDSSDMEKQDASPSDAKSRDTSRIDAECSMHLYVTPSRLAESCDTLASRPFAVRSRWHRVPHHHYSIKMGSTIFDCSRINESSIPSVI